jgi:RPA family protein
MPEVNQNQKRQIAYKVRIKELANGKYVKEEGWQPNYIITTDGRQINRINLIATVVSKPIEEGLSYQSIILDDGTGRISIRNFEQNDLFNNIEIGDIILLIGRPREYGNEIYILPETLKKVQDKAWIKVRELELKNNRLIKKIEDKTEPKEVVEDAVESISDKVIRIIKEKDQGEGIDFEDILKQVNNEKIIKELLKKGELFEIRPGRLKVLE